MLIILYWIFVLRFIVVTVVTVKYKYKGRNEHIVVSNFSSLTTLRRKGFGESHQHNSKIMYVVFSSIIRPCDLFRMRLTPQQQTNEQI